MRNLARWAAGAVVGLSAAGVVLALDNPESFDPARSRMVVVPDGEVSAAATDPYDDLGDFVATWDVRSASDVGTSRQRLQYGRLQIARRDGWMSFALTMQQPMAGEDGRIEDQHWIQEAWIFHEGRCEGHVMNGGLTVDPLGVAPSQEIIAPLLHALGTTMYMGYGPGDPTRLVTYPESEMLLRQGFLPDRVDASRSADGMEVREREGATGRELDGGGVLVGYVREGFASPGSRRRESLETGLRLLGGAGEAVEVPSCRSRVLRWAGKLPAELEGLLFTRPDLESADRESVRRELEARRTAMADGTGVSEEFSMSLLNVRNATAADRVTMKDWEDAVVGIEFGPFRGQYQDVRTSTPEGGTAVAWRVEPTSQRWVQGTP